MSTLNLKQIFFIFFTISTLILSCTKKDELQKNTNELTLKNPQELNLAIWSNYLSPEMAQKFTEETGIKLNISNYSSNEDLMAKLQVGNSGIDVAVPSDYLVAILAKQGQLLELQKNQIPNLAGISANLLNHEFDQGNKFSLPYSWTTTGIAVNRELYKGKIESWKDVLENDQLKGKISLLDDVREVTGLALKKEGKSINSISDADLKNAKNYLLKVKKNIKVFQSDSIDLLINKAVAVAQSYSSDALNAWNKTAGKIEYILPKEGSSIAIDNLVILKSTKNSEAAHKLLNFLLSEKANINFVNTQFGGPVLSGTKDKLDQKLKDNSALFPSAEALSKLEAVQDLGDKTKSFEDIWTAVKTAN